MSRNYYGLNSKKKEKVEGEGGKRKDEKKSYLK